MLPVEKDAPLHRVVEGRRQARIGHGLGSGPLPHTTHLASVDDLRKQLKSLGRRTGVLEDVKHLLGAVVPEPDV